MIEASVAVVVACLPSFRVLFAHGRRQSEVRRAVTLKRFHHRRSGSHSDDLVGSLENGGWGASGSSQTQATSAEEVQQQEVYLNEEVDTGPYHRGKIDR